MKLISYHASHAELRRAVKGIALLNILLIKTFLCRSISVRQLRNPFWSARVLEKPLFRNKDHAIFRASQCQ